MANPADIDAGKIVKKYRPKKVYKGSTARTVSGPEALDAQTGVSYTPTQFDKTARSPQVVQDYIAAGRAGDSLQQQGTDLFLPPGGGGGGGGGGGYGGGGSATAQAQAQALAFQQLLGSRAFTAGSIDGELGQVTQAVSDDQASSKKEYDALAKFFAGQGNAHRDMTLQSTPQVDAGLMQLLAASGTDSRAYQGQGELANTLAGQSDSAADRLRATLAGVSEESRTSRIAESKQASQFNKRELTTQGNALQAALKKGQKDEQKALDAQKMQVVMQLISAMSAGGQSVDVSQYFGGK